MRPRRSRRAAVAGVQAADLVGVRAPPGVLAGPCAQRLRQALGRDAQRLELVDEAQQLAREAARARGRGERMQRRGADDRRGDALARERAERPAAHAAAARALLDQPGEAHDLRAEDDSVGGQLRAVALDVGERRHDEDRILAAAQGGAVAVEDDLGLLGVRRTGDELERHPHHGCASARRPRANVRLCGRIIGGRGEPRRRLRRTAPAAGPPRRRARRRQGRARRPAGADPAASGRAARRCPSARCGPAPRGDLPAHAGPQPPRGARAPQRRPCASACGAGGSFEFTAADAHARAPRGALGARRRRPRALPRRRPGLTLPLRHGLRERHGPGLTGRSAAPRERRERQRRQGVQAVGREAGVGQRVERVADHERAADRAACTWSPGSGGCVIRPASAMLAVADPEADRAREARARAVGRPAG